MTPTPPQNVHEHTCLDTDGTFSGVTECVCRHYWVCGRKQDTRSPCILLVRLVSVRDIGRAMDHDHVLASVHQAFPEHFHVWHAGMAINWANVTEEDHLLT